MDAIKIRYAMKWVDLISQLVCWFSVLMLFAELSYDVHDSLHPSVLFFLCVERLIAILLMNEYFFRVYEDYKHPELTPDIGLGKRYITSFIGIVDLVSWLPFLIGFFVPVQYLGMIRALRILRLLKFFRYNKHLQLIAMAFYRSWKYLKTLAIAMVVLILLNAVLIHEAEKEAQPEAFGTIWNCIWFELVSAATVGYGDLTPKTPLGKILTVTCNFIPTIFVFSAMVGLAGGMFLEVIREHCDVKASNGNDILHDV